MPFSITIHDLSKSYGPKDVLTRINFSISQGDRVGVVAPNGTGKSTLLKLIAGIESIDEGRISPAPATTLVGYLSQERERQQGETLRAFLERKSGVTDANNRFIEASEALASGSANADDVYSEALDRYLRLGVAEFDVRIGEVCLRVDLSPHLLDVPMTGLSGGQAARAGLAAILLSRFDVLLLDEPTNDLDFKGLTQLEEFLANQTDTAFVVVSHDRAFLERTITSVLEIDDVQHTASLFQGGWNAFLEERAVVRTHAEERFQVYTTKRDQLKERADAQRRWAATGVAREKNNPRDNDKVQRDFRINSSEKQASKARASEKALDRLERVDKPWEGWELRMDWQFAQRSSDVVAYLQEAVVKQGEFRLGPIDLELRWADRLAIVGPNGSGKTTLVRALLGEIPLSNGKQYLATSTSLVNLNQQRDLLDSTQPCVDVFVKATGVLEQEARSLLAKFGLSSDHVQRAANSLSPGERTRTLLASVVAVQPNLIVLDEPTNHLDLEAIEQMESALSSYGGTVVLITHDRRFLEAVKIDRVLELAES